MNVVLVFIDDILFIYLFLHAVKMTTVQYNGKQFKKWNLHQDSDMSRFSSISVKGCPLNNKM